MQTVRREKIQPQSLNGWRKLGRVFAILFLRLTAGHLRRGGGGAKGSNFAPLSSEPINQSMKKLAGTRRQAAPRQVECTIRT
ncbi:hypothetical protein [Mesorhizobium sophorae]|uniref:hypothetical protein n=1 Tax=Mesorhizobium sophorae TaxID=1300294 RepID=UPI001180CCB1|nr:hypothetical protein [Mesorhizobium sophorae]